jgi:galactofuranose transport system permease protein
LITNGLRVQITYKPYAFIGQGWIILPFSLYLVAILLTITWFMTRKTAIGLFIESVGVNFRSSFYSGIDEKKIKLLVYTFCGFCAGIAGLVASSNVRTSDASNIGLTTELDAILAVVIGGTSMSGGVSPCWPV